MKKFIKRFFKRVFSKAFFFDAVETLLVLAVFAGLGIWYAVGARTSDPEQYAMKYFENFLVGNYDELYNMVDVTESGFVNKKYFTNWCKSDSINGGIKDYSVKEISTNEKGEKHYEISYKKKDDSEGVFQVYLQKQPEKTCLVFPSWKVDISRQIIDKYTISIPNDMDVKLDGVPLDAYYEDASLDGSMKYYTIVKMMSGEHTITISGDKISTKNQTFYVKETDKEKEFKLEDFSMVSSEEQELRAYSKYVVNQLYQSALSGMDYELLSDMFSESERRQAALQCLYESIVNWSVGVDGAKLQEFTIDKISTQVYKYTYPSEVVIRVEYKYSYTSLTSWNMLTTNQGVLEGDGKATSYICYRKNRSGEWKLIRIKMKLPDYAGEPIDADKNIDTDNDADN